MANGFMDLLKMLVIPLIFVSIMRVIINMKQGENLGKLTARTLGDFSWNDYDCGDYWISRRKLI